MQEYLAHLRVDGVLAIHISNRYLDLDSVLGAIQKEHLPPGSAGIVVSDNNGIGIYALFAKLADSTVIDNIRAGTGKDLVTSERPRLRNVVCNASRGWGSQSLTPWGVCALDE